MAFKYWILRFWDRWPPGLAVAMLGLLAALFPLIASGDMSTRERFFWAAGFASLVILESRAILKERAKTERATAEQMRSLEGLRAAADANHTAVIRLLIDRFTPVDDLKTRALTLSESILDFVYQRLQNAPRQPIDLFSYERHNRTLIFDPVFDQTRERSATVEYEVETTRLYRERFGEKARVVVAEMAARGLSDEVLDGLLATPLYFSQITSMVRDVGERIGQLAERITAKGIDTSQLV